MGNFPPRNPLKSLKTEKKSGNAVGEAEAAEWDLCQREFGENQAVSHPPRTSAYETLEDEAAEQGDYGKINHIGLVEKIRAKAFIIG